MKIYKKYFYSLPFVLILASISLFQSCDSATDAVTDLLFPPSKDAELGLQLDKQIKAEGKMKISTNIIAIDYLQNMLDKIKLAPEVEYEGTFPYKIAIIEDNETVNAFTTPGGYIYVYTGLIRFLDNEATLAGVIAHEVAHCERRHAAKRMTKKYGAQVLLELALGSNPSEMEKMGSQMLSGLGLLWNSREDEYEADKYSFKYLKSTKWYPGGINFFFNKVKSGNESSFKELLQTHPMPQNRLDAIQKMIKDANLAAPTEANLLTIPYNQFKRQL